MNETRQRYERTMSSLCLWKQEGKTFCRLLQDAVSGPRPRHFFRLGVQANFLDGGFRYFKI